MRLKGNQCEQNLKETSEIMGMLGGVVLVWTSYWEGTWLTKSNKERTGHELDLYVKEQSLKIY